MAIEPDKLLRLQIPEVRQVYDWRDTALYALGLGYGDDPLDEEQLSFLDETRIQAVPTLANVLGHPGFWMRDLDTGIDHLRVVHGEHAMTLHRPLPAAGTVIGRTRIVDLVDKGEGRGALVYSEREVCDGDSGELFATVLQTTFCRADGGFGGKHDTPHKPHPEPQREADFTVEIPTLPQAALIYRLSGDYNPLHSDPATARAAGYVRPILHGLATFGLACRGLMLALCSNESARVHGLAGRFSAPVYPGETVALDVWREAPGRAAFRARVSERQSVVLKNGRLDYSPPKSGAE